MMEKDVEKLGHVDWKDADYNIGIVIQNRREELGMTRAELCDGICSERTIYRVECQGALIPMKLIKPLLERLGLL